MSKLALVAISTAAVASAIAAVSYQLKNPAPDTIQAASYETSGPPSSGHDLSSIRFEQVTNDMQAQVHETARLLSQLNARLDKIEQTNRAALEALSEDIDEIASKQELLESPAFASDDTPNADPETIIEDIRKQVEQAIPAKERSAASEHANVTKFYEHGEIDPASAQMASQIGRALESDLSKSTEVLGVECRNEVCKVDYRPGPSGDDGSGLAELEIITAITIEMGKTINIANESYKDGTSSIFIK